MTVHMEKRDSLSELDAIPPHKAYLQSLPTRNAGMLNLVIPRGLFRSHPKAPRVILACTQVGCFDDQKTGAVQRPLSGQLRPDDRRRLGYKGLRDCSRNYTLFQRCTIEA
jgi:hypothetical protein